MDQLQHYANKVEREIIGLEKKLSDADLNAIIDYALECKEKFEKILYEQQYSRAAQDIYLYFISKARSIFKLEFSIASAGMRPEEKVEFVRKQIVQVLHDELGKNPLGIG